jgi:hypothetical protein
MYSVFSFRMSFFEVLRIHRSIPHSTVNSALLSFVSSSNLQALIYRGSFRLTFLCLHTLWTSVKEDWSSGVPDLFGPLGVGCESGKA